MTVAQIIVIVAFSTAGATVQGSAGIGLALVAGPALVAIDPGFAPGPLLLAAQLISTRHIVAEREMADRTALRHALIGLPAGMAVGLTVLVLVSDSTLAVLVGALTVVSSVLLLAGLRPNRTRATEISGGGVCTFAAVTAGLPGPPLVIAFNDMAPPTMRATTSMFVFTVATLGFASLLITGNFGWHELRLLGWLVPGVVLGLVMARWVRPVVDRLWFRPAVLTVSLLGGLALVASQF